MAGKGLAPGHVEVEVLIPAKHVGYCIGKQGAQISAWLAATGCTSIVVPHSGMHAAPFSRGTIRCAQPPCHQTTVCPAPMPSDHSAQRRKNVQHTTRTALSTACTAQRMPCLLHECPARCVASLMPITKRASGWSLYRARCIKLSTGRTAHHGQNPLHHMHYTMHYTICTTPYALHPLRMRGGWHEGAVG